MTSSARIYRDVPTPLYAEFVKHAEARGLTVPAWLEELARAHVGIFTPNGDRRDTPLRFPRLAPFVLEPEPVIDSRSGLARPRTRPRNVPAAKAHRLENPQERARFEAAVPKHRNSELAAMFGVTPQTIANWREWCGLPAAGSAEGRAYRSVAKLAETRPLSAAS
jgi:hypothetical protein